jgi:hypothetical protein
MACYSYNSGNPILYNNNIEVVYNVGSTLSFSSIAWLCEFPVNEQLAVYSRPTPGGVETLLIENTNYTVNTTLNRIELITSHTGQIVIRRTTASDKMLFKFVDGAKLTATQLNASLHQLLFTIQEKEFAGSTFNHIYSLSSTVPAWVTATAYTTGQVVSNAGSLYLCIANHTSSTAPPNANWNLINPSLSGFVFIGGTNPVVFNLTSLTAGNTLVWDGTQFVSGNVSGTANNLSEFSLSSLSNGQVLIYDGALSKFRNRTITVDLTQSNLIFADRTFYNNATNTSYTNNGTSITLTGGKLSQFKNAAGTKWVLTDPPTVYHIVKTLTPGSQDPDTFFDSINTSINGLIGNISNPIKAKLEWDLGLRRTDIIDTATGEYLSNSKSAFWDHPDELYSTGGYNLAAPTPLKWHGVLNGTTIHRVSPYFYQTLTAPATEISFVSKIKSYGIKSFYLSVPECHSSNFIGLPVLNPSNPLLYLNLTTITSNDLYNQLNEIGNENQYSSERGYYRDYYLMHLRDMVFAGARANPSSYNSTKTRDSGTRHKMGLLLKADYREDSSSSKFKEYSFFRLEGGESPQNVLWKIPRQMIYYNAAAMSHSNTLDSGALTVNSINNTFKKAVRFTGQSEFRTVPVNANSTVSYDGMGVRFKADAYWDDWVTKWDEDAAITKDKYSFNEAMVDWIVTGLSQTATDLNLYQFRVNLPPLAGLTGVSAAINIPGTAYAKHLYPWPYRPNDIRDGSSTTLGAVGTLYLNIDSNTIFSSASNYIPDPTDEYVYRVVLKKGLLSLFKENTYDTLKSAIILEHGFSDDGNNKETTNKTSLASVFKHGTEISTLKRLNTRLDKNNVKVYVKNEGVETIAGGDERYVITIGIQVPRLKSIGYARLFRNSGFASNIPRSYNSAAADVDKDLGPWTWNQVDLKSFVNFGGSAFDSPPASSVYATSTISQNSTLQFNLNANSDTIVPHDLISGRNECAVKFTRLGLPGNLWIRMSVLSTEGTVGLISSSGFSSAANE